VTADNPIAVDKPSPVPLLSSFVVKNGSKIRSMISGGMPVSSIGHSKDHILAAILLQDSSGNSFHQDKTFSGLYRHFTAVWHCVTRIYTKIHQYLM